MDFLNEAKNIAAGSGRSSDLERAQTYAAIALVEAVCDVGRKLGLINSKLNALLKQGQPEAKVTKPKAVRRKTSGK